MSITSVASHSVANVTSSATSFKNEVVNYSSDKIKTAQDKVKGWTRISKPFHDIGEQFKKGFHALTDLKDRVITGIAETGGDALLGTFIAVSAIAAGLALSIIGLVGVVVATGGAVSMGWPIMHRLGTALISSIALAYIYKGVDVTDNKRILAGVGAGLVCAEIVLAVGTGNMFAAFIGATAAAYALSGIIARKL